MEKVKNSNESSNKNMKKSSNSNSSKSSNKNSSKSINKSSIMSSSSRSKRSNKRSSKISNKSSNKSMNKSSNKSSSRSGSSNYPRVVPPFLCSFARNVMPRDDVGIMWCDQCGKPQYPTDEDGHPAHEGPLFYKGKKRYGVKANMLRLQ